MKARKPSGQILIIFETDLSQAKSFEEEKLTPIQKAVYDKLSENQKERIKQGYGAVYRDIDTDTEICPFNMDCYNELCLHYDENNPNYTWLKLKKSYFLGPSNDESIIIKQLFTNPKMQESIHVKNILENRPSADVYIADKAKQMGAIVVTVEKFKPNSAQLPNICESLGVVTMSFDDFMGEYIK